MSLPEQRDARIAELETRLRARRSSGVRLPVALVCVAGALFLLVRELPDVFYALSSAEPLTLGREGEYRFDLLTSNRYVQLHGTPSGPAFFGSDGQGRFVVVGLADTPVLVRRALLPAESWTAGQSPPPALRTPFAVRGRLLAQVQAAAYREAFQKALLGAGVRPRAGTLWLVLEGEAPRAFAGAVGVAALLLLFALFNGWLAVQSLAQLGRR